MEIQTILFPILMILLPTTFVQYTTANNNKNSIFDLQSCEVDLHDIDDLENIVKEARNSTFQTNLAISSLNFLIGNTTIEIQKYLPSVINFEKNHQVDELEHLKSKHMKQLCLLNFLKKLEKFPSELKVQLKSKISLGLNNTAKKPPAW